MAISIRLQQNTISPKADQLYKVNFDETAFLMICIQRAVREVWGKTYGIFQKDRFCNYSPVSREKVDRCNEGIEGPKEDEFALDFSEGFMNSLWNKDVIDKLTQNFITARAQHPHGYGLPDVSTEYISGEFFGHLKRSQEAWAKWQPRLTYGGEVETGDDVVERVEKYQQRRQASVNSRSRKQQVGFISCGMNSG